MSTCTRRAAQIAKERNIPYVLVPVDMLKGEHKHPTHITHQPFGQVPYIVVRCIYPILLNPLILIMCVLSYFRGSTRSRRRTASNCSNRALSVVISLRRGLGRS